MPAPVGRLRRRTDFLRVAGRGRKAVAAGLVLQAAESPEGDPARPPRVGFTATKRLGQAVLRNRARRRLRAAARHVMPAHAMPGHDYVLIARAGTLARPFAKLIRDLEGALRRVGAYRPQGEAEGGGRPAGEGRRP